VLAPLVGRWMTTHDPRWMALGGFASLGVGLLWLSRLMDPATSVLLLLAPFFLIGLGNALVWGPLSLTATRNLPPSQAGAGSGVYNETRQVGSVLGSAAIATLMSDRIAARLGDASGGDAAPTGAEAQAGPLPEPLHAPYAAAMGDAMLLPVGLALVGVLAALLIGKPVDTGVWAKDERAARSVLPAAAPDGVSQPGGDPDGPFGPMMGVTGLPGDGGQALLERLRTRLGRIRTALRCGQVLLEPVEPGGELRALPRDLCVLLRDVAAQGRLALLPPRLPVMQRCV